MGRGWTLLPFNKKPFGWVFGRPITTGGNKSVEELHAEFCYEIERIFEEYKARFGYGPEERLDIVSVKVCAGEGHKELVRTTVHNHTWWSSHMTPRAITQESL